MTTAARTAGSGGAQAPPHSTANTLLSWIFKLAGLAIVDAIGIWLIWNMLRDGLWQLALVLAVVTLLINVVLLRQDLYPLRWISPGLALLIIIVIYPILSTLYVSLTNYGDGHLLSKPVALRLLAKQTYLPEGAPLYDWTAYVSPTGDYLLWLQSPDGAQKFLARPNQPVEPQTGDAPATIGDYQQISKAGRLQHTAQLVQLTFGAAPDEFRVSDKRIGKAAQYQPRYEYNAERDELLDKETSTIYRPIDGTYTAVDDPTKTVTPGYQVNIGTRNFVRLFTSPALREPFILVFLWTIAFAALSALATFALGLYLAITFDSPDMPFKRVLRSLLLIPYAIPAFISVPLWKGLLTPEAGVISMWIERVFGMSPAWFSDPLWAKVGILIVNLWLGFPYMFLITTGALQALPRDMYEAADIEGASAWAQFRSLTLPMLLIAVGPLLVGSFAFNFNNFGIIELYNKGGPPMSGTISPVGHTDILATYTARIAFFGGRGSDLGYAAAITVIIFLILLVITFFQFRYTNMLEEASQNV